MTFEGLAAILDQVATVAGVLAAQALPELGLSLLVAHLIIFWVSQDANLTPPICIAAFAAASIADAKPMATGMPSWKLGRGLYIVPLLMAYSPLIGGGLLIAPGWPSNLTGAGLMLGAIASQRWLKPPTSSEPAASRT